MCAERTATKLTSAPSAEVPPGMFLHLFDMPGTPDEPVPFYLSRWWLEPGADSGIDQHYVPELWLVAAGHGEMTCGGKRLEVAAGDVISIEPDQPHTLLNTGQDSVEIFSVWWGVKPERSE